MDKKQLIIGFFVGLFANSLGLILVGYFTSYQSNRIGGIGEVLVAAYREDFLGKLISLGAILNLLCFFYFLKKQQDSRAAGVLVATILVAIFTFLIKL